MTKLMRLFIVPAVPSGNLTEKADLPPFAQIRARELCAAPGSDRILFQLDAPRLSLDDVVIEGRLRRETLRPGLSLHVSDAIERFGFVTQSTLPESLSCIFFLQGEIDLKVGGRPIRAGRPSGREVEGLIINHAEADSFRRLSRDGQHVRHAVITLTPEWLDLDGLGLIDDHRRGRTASREHLANRRWRLSPRAITLVEQLIAPPDFAPGLQRLYLESRAIELVTEALCALSGADASSGRSALGWQNEKRLRRALDFIDRHIDRPMTLGSIAKEVGVSQSVLQRFFHARFDRSVFEYVRDRKLERVREALIAERVSIVEAAAMAGYTSRANFATAFKRRFGVPPSHARKLA